MSLTILAPRQWSMWDRLRAARHPGRPLGLLPAPWVDTFLQQRFACLIACPPCTWKYGDAFRRFGYRRDPEFVGIGRCDFCKSEERTLRLYFAEEKFARLRSTAAARHGEFLGGATHAAGGLGWRYVAREGRVEQWKL